VQRMAPSVEIGQKAQLELEVNEVMAEGYYVSASIRSKKEVRHQTSDR
jgi:hypothetical protein